MTTTIDPKREYTATEILDQKLFPWARHPQTLARMISKDLTGENLLEAQVFGEGKRKRYLIKGRSISKFLKKYGTYLMMSSRKSKQW